MSNVLLIEPDYRSKFPPLGLMRISTFHKARGDCVTFARGMVPALRDVGWHRIYVSSLFTYELPRTVKTVKYYLSAVENPQDVFVGGIGATLLPEYITERVPCTVVVGALDAPGKLGSESPPIAGLVPDYSMVQSVARKYVPEDSYFCRITTGCIRHCKFCAVPVLEPEFRYSCGLHEQIQAVRDRFGERQHLVLLDNNILASDRLERIVCDIREEGFERGATRDGRRRTVDFNQGIDARLIADSPGIAPLLATLNLSPVRLAFDHDSVEGKYRRAVQALARAGFASFTNYVMFNFNDTPRSLYDRLDVNIELSHGLGVRVTGFPMRYVPIDDVTRRYIAPQWNWRYLRGIQCILLATHGMVSPNPDFFHAAFGESYEDFLEIVAMPDRYIIHRNKYKHGEAASWRKLYRKLSPVSQAELLQLLDELNRARNRKALIAKSGYSRLLEHYYPNGEAPHD